MRPERWTLEDLRSAGLPPESVALWAIPEVRAIVEAKLPFALRKPLEELPPEVEHLVVVGGGVLLDEAKVWRLAHRPEARLIAVPSVWGSGAEASPVVVLNREGEKHIRADAELVPDVRVVWPELAEGLPVELAHVACGDAWSHVLEGFLSALASDELRREGAELVREMLETPISKDPRWFDLSARACALQAQSSVGLVHGVAHVLEGPLRAEQPDTGWGHARLCSRLLWPAMQYNRQASDKFSSLLAAHELPEREVLAVCETLYDEADYDALLPLLLSHWRTILRDPCTRTNSALVRPKASAFFADKAFQ